MKNSNGLAVILILSGLWLAIGCSQKTVHSELTPPSSAPAAVPAVTSPDFDQAANSSLGKKLSITASSLEDSGPIVESLESTAAENGSQNKYGLSREGRSSGTMLPVYFDFDRASIREDQLTKVGNNAIFIKKHNVPSIRIEGNCDERGTYEYNLALGERRSLSIKKFMTYLGVDENRIETLSYGEERPLVQGHAESAWALNRRGDFLIEN